ncbi:MAG: tryptophan synthase subunit beta [Thermodesulfobacteriota bacterium]
MFETRYYGRYGGVFVPEVLLGALEELAEAFREAEKDEVFMQEFEEVLCSYGGRPTPLTPALNLTQRLKGACIYIKREDLNHTGAHKLNNVVGQGLLALHMGKQRLIAETGAGQHGVATATVAARLGLACTVFMGEKDVDRQRPNVFWMERLGAEIVAVKDGSRTLKDAVNQALREWSACSGDTHYVLGTACGPHPYPAMVARFQSVIGREARAQVLNATGKLPSRIYACVGGGSNALGLFSAFLDDPVELVGVEAGGRGLETGRHASRLASGEGLVGVVHGYKSRFLQDREGRMRTTCSVAAGLDYVGVSPILADLAERGRVRMEAATDREAIEAFSVCAREEGLIPALESAHALAGAFREAVRLPATESVLVNLSGRGDKDVFTIAEALGDKDWELFLRSRAGLNHA